MLRIRRQRYFSIHTHSEYSVADALGTVRSIVDRARELGYRGLALTDHGNIAGSVELYQFCRQQGIKPFPGSEMYLVEDRNDKKAKRYHFCVVAYTTEGYRNLVNLTTLSHQNFYHKPIVDLNDIAKLADEGKTKGLAMTTGCHFGYVTQKLLNEGPGEARRVIRAFSNWFDVYVELQKHDIDANEEDWTVNELIAIADELDLPLVLGQDSHYTHSEHQGTHDTLKEMLSWSEDPGESKFPGDGYHMVDDQWMIDKFGEEIFEKAMLGHERLLDLHDMDVPEMETYKYRIPSISHDPSSVLYGVCSEKIAGKGKAYIDRLNSEMETVNSAGMADYFLLVGEVCDWMREQGIEYQTRGSAAGSLIAYLMGITNVDPLVWGTSFDRFMGRPARRYDLEFGRKVGQREFDTPFENVADLAAELRDIGSEWLKDELALLATNPKAFSVLKEAYDTGGLYENPSNSTIASLLGVAIAATDSPVYTTVLDRKSPPDIDLDVDNVRRGEVLEWLDERYSVVPIGNWAELGFKSDAQGDQTHDDKGSVVVKYMSSKRKRLRAEGVPPSQIDSLLQWDQLTREEKAMIQMVSDMKPLSRAGTHACGIILCNSQSEMDSLVPKMWIPNAKAMVSQYSMGQVEAIGLVKLDLLGSKTVTVMSRVARELGYDSLDALRDTMTYRDRSVFNAMGRGDTEGVFQLEGYASMLGVKKMRPKSIQDVIAAMALFRPASEGAGATDEFLKRRNKEQETPVRHPIIDDVIKDTNGVVLYQDQVIGILRALGMGPEDLTIFLKAIKASNKNQGSAGKIIDAYMPMIHQMCQDHGVSEEDWEWLQYVLEAATGYGFNLAHATVYGITSYLTQWMQVHHPDVFFANLISVHIDDPNKVAKYEGAARKRKVRILRADIAESHATDYKVVRPGVIRRPLMSIKGVGKIAAQCIQEVQPITDVIDFLGQVNSSKVTGVKDFRPGETKVGDLKGTLKALYEASAIVLPL